MAFTDLSELEAISLESMGIGTAIVLLFGMWNTILS